MVLQSYASIPIDLLEPHPDNPHKGDSDVIAESIGANGFYGAVVAQASSKRIIAGHHRVQAAHKQGLTEVPVLLLDVDDEQAKRIMLADNRTAEYGQYDDAQLAELLQGLPDLIGTGWSDDDLADLLDDTGGIEIVTDEPAGPRSAPPPDPEPEDTASGGRPDSRPDPDDEENDLESEGLDDVSDELVDAPLQPRPKAGTTADLILTVTAAEHDELTDLLGKVRTRDGEATTTQIIMAALRAYAA
ncbi:ParB N-terminal domain-containing protein [Streptosporangium sp. H16]|uniref:ParB N-terminal domain-containing protein n=1 Tax=Streptosporangium sp. H16 TaxID=3444184 RepID=UPI003F79731C